MAENGNGRKQLTQKQWTYIGICGIVIATAGAWQGGKYIYAETIVPVIKDTTVKIYDSLNKETEQKLEKISSETEAATLVSMKTQCYIEMLLNPESINVASSRWKHDSCLYMRGKMDR